MSLDQASNSINLASIDEAYGTSSDLYKDVLGVKSNATPEQIQKAFFARRNELFTLLQNMEHDDQDSITASHHFHAERKMQAVQMTMRILGDPALRLQYDDIRQERLAAGGSRKKQQQLATQPSQSKALVRSRSITRHGSPTEPIKSAALIKKPRYVTPEHKMPAKKPAYMSETETEDDDDDDTRQECPTADQTYEEEQTIMSETSYRSEGTLLTVQPMPQQGASAIIGRVKDEVFGAMEDTATSFAQVLNAFTLQEEDIMAVTKRINKAARQMQTSL
ncbi:hypothetical protein MPSEU_000450800 [Mayamaea pseudoterrestris]|nr:hypothetical protein MPSEU_000450800 [Mayamaea pseudoterrestris]